MSNWSKDPKAKNKRAKIGGLDLTKAVHVEVGDKLNYAMCWKSDDDSLKFMGWIRKYCCSDKSAVIKKTKEEIGL